MFDFDLLKKAMGALDEDAVMKILEEVMADGGKSAQQAMTACQEGMNIVGELFETSEYFVGDLIYAGDLMTRALGVLKSALISGSNDNAGVKMIICTVKGDLHDIGKNIVRVMLEANGFEVIDLGIDTDPEKIVDTAKKEKINIIALSGVLTLALDSMKETVEALKSAEVNAKIIIGGCPVNESAKEFIGADAWAINPQDTVKTCLAWSK